MKRTFDSGSKKKKRKQQVEEQLKKLPRLDSYFTNTAKYQQPNSQGSEPTPIPEKPHTSTELIPVTTTAGVVDNVNDPKLGMTSEEITLKFHSDVGLWNALTEADISYWIHKGPLECQHRNVPFEKSKRSFKNQDRYCSKSLFHSKKVNGETYTREWLVYSPITGCVYCFVCKLFSKSTTTALASCGFADWRNPNAIQNHENSEEHRTALLTYLSRKRGQALDCQLVVQMKTEQQYWRRVIERVVAVICTLAERGLPFRGDKERFGSPHNGNYLGLLELVAMFDPFLSSHIKQYGNQGSGTPSYLSKTICDEFIELMSKKVRDSVLNDLKKAGYFSLCVDSTPDLAHIDQLTVIVRYVSPDDGCPIERFLTFLQLENHCGEYIANMVVEYLSKDCGIDFSKCRGQSYDNAANMAGKFNGMQQKILEKNKYAIYIPCAGHSLNLVGRAAVDCCLDAVNFFGIVQELYNFFSSSTKRWAVLTSFLEEKSKVLKNLSATRWNAHENATLAIIESYASIVEALNHIHTNGNEKGDTRCQAGNLLEKMEELEFVFMLHLWNRLLNELNKTSNALQNPKITLNTCSQLYTSLFHFLKDTRNQFDDIEHKAKSILPDVDYKCTKKRRRLRKKQVNDGAIPDAFEDLSSREKFRVKSFIPILDALETNLARRATVYNHVSSKFSFLVDIEASEEQLREAVQSLMNEYPEDVDISLTAELKHFHAYVRQSQPGKALCHQELYEIIFQDNISSAFPNVEAILRLFLSLMVANCTGERSFSRLKRIKNELRATVAQDKLSALSIMCIESDKLRSLSFDDVIHKFSHIKSRKKII